MHIGRDHISKNPLLIRKSFKDTNAQGIRHTNPEKFSELEVAPQGGKGIPVEGKFSKDAQVHIGLDNNSKTPGQIRKSF